MNLVTMAQADGALREAACDFPAAPSDTSICPAKAQSTTAAAPGPLVLIVDDESQMRRMLRIVLVASGFRTVDATSGTEALAQAWNYNPDLVLLDLGLPDVDGLEVTRRLREWMTAPILVISARGQEQDKVELLDIGANDYVTKPFATGELLARVRVWLREITRVGNDGVESYIDVGDFRIDLARRLVFVAGREVHLTATEYKLFATLMRNAGRVMGHRQLLEATWGPAYANETHYLRVYMRNLRQKLGDSASRPRYLVTESGIGYRLRAD
jgi:two-component system KDP operon response regulator KdpE